MRDAGARVILNDLHEAENVRLIAQKVLQVFTDPFRAAGYEIFVSTSIGISM